MGRQPRDVRRRAVRVRLNERDEALLRTVARMRLVGTSDLGRLLFPGVSTNYVSQRLRRLFDAQYLGTQVRDRSEQNLYVLGPRGRRWAQAQGVSLKAAPRMGREHSLAIVHFWAVIAATLHSSPAWALDRFLPEWEIREALGGLWQPVVPDALLQVSLRSEVPPRVLRAAVEIDLGTERRGVLVQKVRRYRDLLATGDSLLGWADFGLILVLRGWSEARRRDLERLMHEHWTGWWVSWSDSGDGAELLAALRERGEPVITDPHYGSDVAPRASACVAATSDDLHPGDCHEREEI